MSDRRPQGALAPPSPALSDPSGAPVPDGFRATVALLWTWCRREFRARYSQTLFGGLWAVVQPLGVTLAFVFLLRRLGAPTVPGVPYASFVFTGMLCWTLFSSGVTGAVQSLASNMPIIAKVRFPRVVAPVSGALMPLVDFALAGLLLPVVLALQGSVTVPDLRLVAGAVVGTVTLAIGTGLALGAVAIFVRDVRQGLPFVLQLLLLASPVAYPADRLPSFMQLNPMATFISAFRAGVVGTAAPSAGELARAFAVSLAVAGLAGWYFRAVEDRFADVA